MFYEQCLGRVEVARIQKEQTVQCQKQIMWLQVSLLAHQAETAAKLELEIPTWDTKLELYCTESSRSTGGGSHPWQQGNSCAPERLSRRWKIRFQAEGEAVKVHCSPLRSLSWSQLLTMPCCPCLLPPAAAALGCSSAASCTYCLAVPGQPPACRGWEQQGLARVSRDSVPKPGTHRHRLAEERQEDPGRAFLCHSGRSPW